MKNLLFVITAITLCIASTAHGATDLELRVKQCYNSGRTAKLVFQEFRNGKSKAEITQDFIEAVESTGHKSVQPETLARFTKLVNKARTMATIPNYSSDRFRGFIEGQCLTEE